jgi:hypothetical protein
VGSAGIQSGERIYYIRSWTSLVLHNITTFSGNDDPMDKIVSAAEANRRFSQLLRAVREGDSMS